jgi:hypothetical protein
MPLISQKKQEKIQEQILHHLFQVSPQPQFTSKIAESIARDEEFTKILLLDLKSKSLIAEINKNSKGNPYLRRKRWILSQQVFNAYSKRQ